jgi:drug/metabolite transporter (DMT)-like permease
MASRTYRSDLVLLLASAIWGFAFVAQRVAMDYLGPFTFTAVRFSLGTLLLAPLLLTSRFTPSKAPDAPAGERRKVIRFQLLLGLILFGGMSLQQWGLQFTTAGNAGFITGLYVVFVPLVGAWFGHRSGGRVWISVALVTIGLYFLSVTPGFRVNPGDLYVLGCAFFWTAHVLVIAYLAPRTDPIRIAVTQFTICSVLSWIVALALEPIRWSGILDAIWPILYGGALSVSVGYTLQVIAQQKAHPAYASIILSLESVFAVIGGWIILSEPMSFRTLLGCAMMLTGMVLAQIRQGADIRNTESNSQKLNS